MKRISRLFLVVGVILVVGACWTYGQQLKPDNAWEKLLRADPSAADDPSIGWRERLILNALTPEQAEAYFQQGADPGSLLLQNGQTLQEYLDATLSPPVSVYVGLPVPCALFSADAIESTVRYSLRVRGQDLGAQGGSATGCGIPPEATAVILNLRQEGAETGSRVKLWAADGPEPANGLLEAADPAVSTRQTTVVVALAGNDAERDLLLGSTAAGPVSGEVVGYFRALRAGDAPGGPVSFYTEGANNNFFGSNAGASTTGSYNAFFGGNAGWHNTTGTENSFFGMNAGNGNTEGYGNSFFGSQAGIGNTTGHYNSFFGIYAGYSSTAGSNNSFFGVTAGQYNTTGSCNASLGRSAGWSNTVESNNTFVGYNADLNPGADPMTSPVTNATALGYRAYVSQSNSLVLGSIAELNGATDSVNVGIGTPAPSAPLHVYRADGTAMIKVEENYGDTANRVLFRLTNNGAPWFKLLNSNSGQEWTFAMDQYDNFIFSRIGTGGAEFKIYQSGEVTMGPGGSEVFDLEPTGDLEIAGGLTAGGIYYASDRNRKTDIEPLDIAKVLETIAHLPVSTWRFKTEDEQIRHAGPMAQDFRAAFGLGNDDKTISASDISGVAVAAIQGLYRENVKTKAELAEKDAAIAQLRAEKERQQAQINELMKAVAALQALQRPRVGDRVETVTGD